MEVVNGESTGWIEHLKHKPGSTELQAKRRWAATNGGFLLLYKAPQQNASKLDRKSACGGAMLPAAGEISLQSSLLRIWNKDNSEAVMTLRASSASEAEKWLAVLKQCQKKVVEVEHDMVLEDKENDESSNASTGPAKIGGVVLVGDQSAANAATAAAAAAEREARVAIDEKARLLEVERETMRREIAQLQKRQRASEEIIKIQQQKMKSVPAAVQPAVLAERLRLLTEDHLGAEAPVPAAVPSSSSKPPQKGKPSGAGGDSEPAAAAAAPGQLQPQPQSQTQPNKADDVNAAEALRREAEKAETELLTRKAAQDMEESQRAAEIRQLRAEADRIQREEEEARERARAEAELQRIRIEAATRAAEEERQRQEDEAERARVALALATKVAADRQYEELLKKKSEQERRGRIFRAAEERGGVDLTFGSGGTATGATTAATRNSWTLTMSLAVGVLVLVLALGAAMLPHSAPPSSTPSNLQSSTTSASSRMHASTASGSSLQTQLAPDEMEVLLAADRIMAKAQRTGQAKAHAQAQAQAQAQFQAQFQSQSQSQAQAQAQAQGLPRGGPRGVSGSLGANSGANAIRNLADNVGEREEDMRAAAVARAEAYGSDPNSQQALAFRTMLRSFLSVLTSPLRVVQRVWAWALGGTWSGSDAGASATERADGKSW